MRVPLLVVIGLTLLGAVVGLVLLLAADSRANRSEWARLAVLQPADPPSFSPAIAAAFPNPARRYFLCTIALGTPLLPVAEIDMKGQFSLGTNDDPRYQPMQARQILDATEGFVWSMRTRGGMPLSGSDSASWTRFCLFGLIPVARLGGNPDHRRSAYGRYAAEAAF